MADEVADIFSKPLPVADESTPEPPVAVDEPESKPKKSAFGVRRKSAEKSEPASAAAEQAALDAGDDMAELQEAIEEQEPSSSQARDDHVSRSKKVTDKAAKLSSKADKAARKMQKEVQKVETALTDASSRRESLKLQLGQMAAQQQEMGLAQEKAGEDEDFELADTLQTQLDECYQNEVSRKAELDLVPHQIAQLEAQKDQLLEQEVDLRNKTERELEELRSAHQAEVDELLADSLKVRF